MFLSEEVSHLQVLSVSSSSVKNNNDTVEELHRTTLALFRAPTYNYIINM